MHSVALPRNQRKPVCSDLNQNLNQNADLPGTTLTKPRLRAVAVHHNTITEPIPPARSGGRTCTRRKAIWNGVIMQRIHARRKAAVAHCSSCSVPRSASMHSSTPAWRGQLTQCNDHVRLQVPWIEFRRVQACLQITCLFELSFETPAAAGLLLSFCITG